VAKYTGLLLAFLPLPILAMADGLFFGLERSEFTGTIFWYYYLLLLGVNLLPIIHRFFSKSFDGGVALAKLLGMLIVFGSNWLLSSLGLLNNDEPGLVFCLVIFLTLGHLTGRGRHELPEILARYRRQFFVSEALFFGVFLFFLCMNSFHPEIYWGEKPMDFTLLNFLVRNTTLPIEDPWFAGQTMNYYYFGHYLYACMVKVSGVTPEVGYALAVATTAGLFASSCFHLIYRFTKRVSLAAIGALCLSFSGNPFSFLAPVFQNAPLDMQTFWSSTRLFLSGGFAEYPSWSFLFADLHAHMMSYPFVVAFLAVVIAALFEPANDRIGSSSILIGVLWGALLAINTWDVVIYTLILSSLTLTGFIFSPKRGEWFFEKIPQLVLGGFVALLLYAPMLMVVGTGRGITLSIFKGMQNPLSSYALHQGHWWLATGIMFAPFALRKWRRGGIRMSLNILPVHLFIAIMVLVLFGEHIVFMDRLNTVFKVGNNTFILWGLLTTLAMRPLWFYAKKRSFIPLHFLVALCLCPPLVGTYFNLVSINSFDMFKAPRPSLHGSRFLERHNVGDFTLVEWARKNVRGTPVSMSRYGASFDHDAGIFPMHTGIPSYLVWDSHVYLRGASPADIDQRKRDIDFVYSSADAVKVHELLLERGISFVVLGRGELTHYPAKGLAKFASYKDLFVPLINSGDSTLYGVGNYSNYLVGR
jgi:uncharacterized membrane protein